MIVSLKNMYIHRTRKNVSRVDVEIVCEIILLTFTYISNKYHNIRQWMIFCILMWTTKYMLVMIWFADVNSLIQGIIVCASGCWCGYFT